MFHFKVLTLLVDVQCKILTLKKQMYLLDFRTYLPVAKPTTLFLFKKHKINIACRKFVQVCLFGWEKGVESILCVCVCV